MRIKANYLDRSGIKRSRLFISLDDVIRFERSPPAGIQPNRVLITVDGLPLTPPFNRSGGLSSLQKVFIRS